MGITGYGSDHKIGDKILISTKEEMEENDRLFNIHLKQAQQIIKAPKQEKIENNRRILLDDEYFNRVINIAVENKWVKAIPIEDDLLPFE